MDDKVETFLENQNQWSNELRLLRSIVLETGLIEEFKWKQLCYTFDGKNIVILGKLKNNCVLGFFKGALLQDSKSLLEAPGENSQHVRQLKFISTEQIEALTPIIKAYIFEAIEVAKLDLKVHTKDISEYALPQELILKFEEDPLLKTAFEALTPGRQKGYLLYFAQAKQSSTRTTRIEKYAQRIMSGKGINDCICGLSNKMPNCDGSHKTLKTQRS